MALSASVVVIVLWNNALTSSWPALSSSNTSTSRWVATSTPPASPEVAVALDTINPSSLSTSSVNVWVASPKI